MLCVPCLRFFFCFFFEQKIPHAPPLAKCYTKPSQPFFFPPTKTLPFSPLRPAVSPSWGFQSILFFYLIFFLIVPHPPFPAPPKNSHKKTYYKFYLSGLLTSWIIILCILIKSCPLFCKNTRFCTLYSFPTFPFFSSFPFPFPSHFPFFPVP